MIKTNEVMESKIKNIIRNNIVSEEYHTNPDGESVHSDDYVLDEYDINQITKELIELFKNNK